MSVASSNRFALFAEDQPAAPLPEKAAPPTETRAAQKPAGRGRGRGKSGNQVSRGGGVTQTSEAPTDDREHNVGTGRVQVRGRGRGGRGERGRGRGRGEGRRDFDRHGGFDRHSGTGKRDSEKTVHQGWGGDEGKTELAVEEGARKDAAKDVAVEDVNAWAAEGGATTVDEWGTPAERAQETPQAQEVTPVPAESALPKAEEDDNTLTLGQYLATKKNVSVVPQLEPRQPNDGKDDFPEGDILNKDDNEEEYFSAQKKSAPKAKRASEKKQRQVLDVSFETPHRGGRGGRGSEDRGFRARERVGRGRGRGNALNGAGHTPDVDDQSAFPSLS